MQAVQSKDFNSKSQPIAFVHLQQQRYNNNVLHFAVLLVRRDKLRFCRK